MAYTTEALVEAEILQDIDTTTKPTTAQVATWITEAQAEIDELAGTKFEARTVTSAIIPFNKDTAFTDDSHLYWYNLFRQVPLGYTYNAIFLQDTNGAQQRRPITCICCLDINNSAVNGTQADSFVALTQNTGSGGHYIADFETGKVVFLCCVPLYGHPRAIRTTFIYGYASVPAVVQMLATKLVARRVIGAKAKTSQFASVDSISLDGVSISKNIGSTTIYLKNLDDEIKSLKQDLIGTYRVDVAR